MPISKNFKTKGNVSGHLGQVEGVPATNYVWELARAAEVPLINTGNMRYWPIIGTVRIPAGATIPEGEVGQDHCALRGQALSASVNSRIWGGSSLVEVTSPATTNAEIGQALAWEADVNNKSGLHLDNLGAGGDVGGILVASGGGFAAKFALCVSKLASAAGFFVGLWFREHSLRTGGFGIYFGNVEPAVGIRFGDDYAGGPAMQTNPGQDALYMRTTSGPYARVRSELDRLVMNVGEGGRYVANAANSENLEILENTGLYRVKAQAMGMGVIADNTTAAAMTVTAGSRYQLQPGSLRLITSFVTLGEGQTFRLLAMNGNVTIQHNASVQLAGGVDAVMKAGTMMTFERWGTVVREVARVDLL